MTQAAVDAVPMMRAPAPVESSGAPPAGRARPAGGREGLAAEFARLLRAAADLESVGDATALAGAFAPLPLEQLTPEEIDESSDETAEDAELGLLPDLQSDAESADDLVALEEATAGEPPQQTAGAGTGQARAAESAFRMERPVAMSELAGQRANAPDAEQPTDLQAEAPAAREPRTAPSELARESAADRIGMAEGDPGGAAGTERLAAEAGERAGRDANGRDGAPLRLPQLIDPLAEASGTRQAGNAPSAPRGEATTETRIVPELPARNEHELVNRVRLLADTNGGTARIQLQPPQLGGLDVKLTVTERFVQLDLVADRMPVAELIGRHLPELQNALEAHGLRIDRANIEFRDRDLGQQQSTADRDQRGAGDDRPNGGERREDPREAQDRMLRTALHGSLGTVDVRV